MRILKDFDSIVHFDDVVYYMIVCTDFFVTISDKNNPQKKWGLSTSWQAGLLTVKKILLNTSPCRSVRFDAFFHPPHCTVHYDWNFRNVFKYYEAFFQYEI